MNDVTLYEEWVEYNEGNENKHIEIPSIEIFHELVELCELYIVNHGNGLVGRNNNMDWPMAMWFNEQQYGVFVFRGSLGV